MADENQTGTATETGAGITVAQLAAQLTKKAPPDAGAGTHTAGTTLAPGATPAEEAPAGETPGTGQELFGENAETGTGEPGATGEGGETDTGAPEWYQKRIAKITAKQRALEERLAAAEKRAEDAAGELDKTRAQVNGKTKVWNFREQELQQQLAHKRELVRWAEENADGAQLTDDKGNEVSYSPEQVRSLKLSAQEDIGDLRGQLREHQTEMRNLHEYWDSEAVKAYPALKDESSETARNIQTMLDKLPWLREVPDARISLADMLAGRAARLKRAPAPGGGTAPNTTTKPPLRAPTGGSAPARAAEGEPSADVKAAQQTFQETGRAQDLARRFAAERKV